MASPARSLLLLGVTVALLLDACQTDEKVSFYGASYIHLPVQEAKSTTDISFRFRTVLADTMLLLAAGRTDYCLIKLESGRLKVHINLGAGEKELASARELILNDLTWHEVNVTRRDANITVSIDVIHSVSDVLPGRFFELNINFGVYIGGQNGFNELFLGHTEHLRGCMADIVYNGIRVIEYARSRKNSTEATAVSWGCSAEFDAATRTEISFVEDGAFAAIPRAIPRSGSRWELELKTAATSGLLLFNAGQLSHADFLGVELQSGRVRLLMNKGNGPTELFHPRAVADGVWHRIQIDFWPSFVGISVDGQSRNLTLPAGNRYLDLTDTIYIGGTELNKRAKVLAKGLKSGDVSFRGCLRAMLLDNKGLGLPHVKVSQGLVAGCVWGFPCADAEPCVPGASCSQLGVRSFKCTCDQTLCIKSNFTDEYKFNTNLPISLELLSVRPLNVAEGQRTIVTERNIVMILDIARFGLNESNVAFGLLTQPAHGSLHIDRMRLGLKTPFSLYDVHQQKISYQHDGSETTEDSMILKVGVQANVDGTRNPLPSYFQDSLRFTLHVNVTSVNDPPRLEIPPNAMLRLAQGTSKTLSKDLVWTIDADTPAESLVYTVLNDDEEVGYVERNLGHTAHLVRSFTQADLARGVIDYIHTGKNKSKSVLGLKVSDGEASSSPQYLHVVAYPLTIKPQHNTGLVVVHRSFSYLTPTNLSFTTDAEDTRIEIRYSIVRPPQYGVLQRQRELNHSWNNTDYFTSRDLEQQTVRYLHNLASPHQDAFSFQVSVREVRWPTVYDFNITFIILELLEINRNSVNFTNSADVVIDSRKIKYQTNPLIVDPSMIIYSILETPRFGHVYLDYERLRVGQTLTQRDVDSNKFRYKHFKRAYSPIQDKVVFKVSASQCPDITTSLEFYYHPHRNTDLPVNVQTIHVVEGERVPLKSLGSNFRDFGVSSLNFHLIENPRHGCLTIYNDTLPVKLNALEFTSEDVARQSVFYAHDDSETTEDGFEYLAVSSDDTDFMYIGTVQAKIKLKNDNPPTRINRRILYVVSRSSKLITRGDLSYVDDDVDTKPSDLIYTVKQLSNGSIVRINEPSHPINRFTQQDIDDEKILYRHRGNEHERIDFTVSDGELFTNGDLEIQAGQAYVRLLMRNHAVVQANHSVYLTTNDIDVETNVNVKPDDVSFMVIERPRYGVILKYNLETWTFSKEDLIRKTVAYKHIGGSVIEDQIKLKVNVRGAEDINSLIVNIPPKSYWEPLIVHNNNTVYVEEATSVILNRKSLEIGYPDIPPNRIVYHVREWPKNGYLEVQTHRNVEVEENDDFEVRPVEHFEQSLLNSGLVYYVQSAPNQTHDKFVVDVTNGITWLRNLTVNIVVVPDKLYVAARNLTVLESKSVVLQESDFYAVTFYFAGKITDYRILEKPKHGEVLNAKNSRVKKFTHKQLNNREIVYKHNGDEASTDYFKMVVLSGEKGSEPFDVWINVIPINDEIPVLVNKTKFTIWEGGSITITNDLLAAVDNDTLSTDVVFNIKNVTNGYFSLTESPGAEIHNFSQEMINTFKVLFSHTNGSKAEFNFTVNDGLHTSEMYTLTVNTKPVRIMVLHNEVLNIFPLARKPISNKLLLSKCTDGERDVKYFIRNSTSMGKIIMETNEGTWIEVDRFTQKDLNNSKVLYEHNRQFNNLNATDSFVFDIETYYAAPIKNQVFNIDISVSSGGLHRYVSVTPIHVDEGGVSPFTLNVTGIVNFLRTKAGIPHPSVSLKLIKQPNFGHVMLLPDLNLTVYSQSDAESGKIAYFHDHSDTLKDQIEFSVFFTLGQVTLCNVTVPVDIAPINDAPFKLEIVKPIDVVQNQTQTITRDNLLTTDPDTPPEDIVYEIINPPNHGRLLLFSAGHDSRIDVQHQAQKFTQSDVDSSRLVYEHKGPLLPSSFYFRVSDGHFNLVYQIFDIHVHPIKLSVRVLKPVEIQQGSTSATIGTESLKLDTNVRQDLVNYEVTRPPRHGVLHARDRTTGFRHADLLGKSVLYEQQDMTVGNDTLELCARVSEFELKGVVLPIRVVPLMIVNTSLEVFAGERTKLSIAHFDATPLAKEAGTDPVFKVTKKPIYAKIMRIMNRTMSSGEKHGLQEKEISRFSHSQILSGVIYLVCKKVPTDDVRGVLDKFEYVVGVPQTAPRFQPASGVFEFRLRLSSDYYNNSLDGPMDPVGHEGEMAIAPNMSDDYTLLLGMLLGVFFLGICVIVTIRCRQSRYKDPDEEDEEEDQDKVEPSSPSSIPLPRPPDHLLPVTPHLKRCGNEHHNNSLSSSTPLPPMMPSLTSTLPQCKVIPLSPMDKLHGSEMDVSARYPYGVPDAEEWSSFETTELPCPSQTSQRTTSNPLLRRNQYWV